MDNTGKFMGDRVCPARLESNERGAGGEGNNARARWEPSHSVRRSVSLRRADNGVLGGEPVSRIGILTAGGDCPGLNAVIRAVVGHAAARDTLVIGFEDGFAGLAEDRSRELFPDGCGAILPLGGSVLGCSGANPFRDQAGIDAGREVFEKHELRCLVVVGGNTSMGTAYAAQQAGIATVGIPKTIDNDVAGTETTVGFDTAVNTATEAIDRLRTTAESHDRIMVVEVMGRDVGWIAVTAGLAGGADVVLTPEEPIRIPDVVEEIRADLRRGKDFSIVVVGEGSRFEGEAAQTGAPHEGEGAFRLGGVGHRLASILADATGLETRVTTLGHIQRGGSPSAADRILATRFGIRAVDLALDGPHGVMVAVSAGDLVIRPLQEVAGRLKHVDPALLEIARAIVA